MRFQAAVKLLDAQYFYERRLKIMKRKRSLCTQVRRGDCNRQLLLRFELTAIVELQSVQLLSFLSLFECTATNPKKTFFTKYKGLFHDPVITDINRKSSIRSLISLLLM